MSSRSSGWSVISLVLTVLALVSCAAPPRAESQALRTQVSDYELEVLVDGEPVRTFAHRGQSYLLGLEGARYVLRIHNRSGRRIEAVVTVDGLDVIDGEPGDFANKRGYLVPAYGSVDIEGWRVSERQAAAFRFAPIGQSYAAKTGRARNVGVIGVAVFPERVVRPAPRPMQPYEYGADADRAGSSEAKAEAPASSAPASAGAERRARKGLGTEFGEAMYSQIEHVSFVRANPTRPAFLLGARYDDRRGLISLGIDVDGRRDEALRESASPFPLSQHYARPPHDWRAE
jgi:hypothetical protein